MSPLYKTGIVVAVILLSIIYYFLDPGELIIFPKCFFFSLTGWYCPGCGSQRAIHHLLHLNLNEVVTNNMLILPGFLLIGYHYSYQAANRKFNLTLPNVLYKRSTPWLIFAIVLGYWIIRNLEVVPFTYFAPG